MHPANPPTLYRGSATANRMDGKKFRSAAITIERGFPKVHSIFSESKNSHEIRTRRNGTASPPLAVKMRQLFDRELLVHNQSPRTQTADIDALNAQIERMQTELATLEVEKNCLEASVASARADFE